MQRPLQYIYQGNALQIMNRMLFNKKKNNFVNNKHDDIILGNSRSTSLNEI